jgi:SAM-dependent methyltransferase
VPAVRAVLKAASRAVPAQGISRRIADARNYWSTSSGEAWPSDSHWRNGLGDEAWLEVGRDHLSIFHRFATGLDLPSSPGRVIEWGCGGGANAVAFAPIASTFLAADVAPESVTECVRQVRAVCQTPVEPVHIDIEDPERAVDGREGSCDTFLCLYVLELTAGPEEALRIVRIAERLLVSGGLAFIQVKYRTADRRTRGHRRDYRRNLANMTTFGIDEFWLRTIDCGLIPKLITLVPRNRLDARYAYYALTKP